MKLFICVPALLLLTAVAQAANPVPFVGNPLTPAAALPGSSGFTLTVNGTSFVSGAVVNWDGSARSTTFVNSTKLTAAITAADVAAATTAAVTVSNPAPGGGASNPVYFVVAVPETTMGMGLTLVPTGGGSSLQARDVNNDGKLDLVSIGTISISNEKVVAQLGNGDGTFQPPITTSAGQPGSSMVLGDFNNDGKLDAVLEQGEDVFVMFGNGDGTFQHPISTFFSGTIVDSFQPGDFNQDGKLDLVVGSSGAVRMLLGNGDGTFQIPSTFYTAGSGNTFSMALGDFNLDGKLDVVVTAELDNMVAVLLGNGDGTLQNGVEYPTTQGPNTVGVADLNGDGVPDLIVTAQGKHAASNLVYLLGNRDGTFQTHMEQTSVLGSVGLGMADFNGDGKVDVAINTPSRQLVQGWFGVGDGSFSLAGYFPVGPLSFQFTTGDFNRDGRPDIATYNQGTGSGASLSILMQGTSIVSPTSLAFGTVQIGSSKSLNATLTNSGSTAFPIASITISGNTTDFHAANNCGSSLGAGASCKIRVTFRPNDGTTPAATLSIVDGGIVGTQGVAITGTAR